MIWLKDSINSWVEAMTVNDVNILKIATPSFLEGRFRDCSETLL